AESDTTIPLLPFHSSEHGRLLPYRDFVFQYPHVLVAIRVPAVERSHFRAHLHPNGSVGLGQSASFHLPGRSPHLMPFVHHGIGQRPFAQLQELPDGRRTKEDGDQREHGALLPESWYAPGFPRFNRIPVGGSSETSERGGLTLAFSLPLRLQLLHP